MRRVLCIPAIVASVVGATAVSATATVTGTTGAVVSVAPPPSVADGAYTSDTEIRAFSERIITLSTAATIATWTWQSNQWAYSSQTFQSGTCFESHLLHRDRTSGTSTTPLAGTVTFDAPILFIIPTNSFTVPVVGTTIRPLDLTDGLLGSGSTTYSSGIPSRGNDGASGGDSVTETASATLAVSQASPSGDAMDEIRVVTSCPPPLVSDTRQVVLLSVGALAVFSSAVLLAWRRTRRRPAVS
jgi:hypothetical protein